MSEAMISKEVLTSDDGIPLKTKLARATRRQKIRALLLVAPLFVFILFTFLISIGMMLTRSVSSPNFGVIMHRTADALVSWNGQGIPEEPAWKAL